ncbi:Spore germination protein [compost metagenome]
MQQTPMPVIVIVAAAISMLAAYRGIRTIALTSSILLPIVLFLGYFVMGANTKYKDYSMLLPILEKGWQPVIEGVFYTLAGLCELWIILLFQHHLRSRLRWWHLMLLGIFIVSMTMGPTLGGITEFGADEAAKQRHTAFEQWRILKVGELLQHVDFLSIYQWLCGSFTRVTMALYLIVDLLNIRKPLKRAIALAIVAAIMAGVGIYPFRDDELLQYLKTIHFPALLSYVGTITILISIGALFRKNRKEPSANESTRQ